MSDGGAAQVSGAGHLSPNPRTGQSRLDPAGDGWSIQTTFLTYSKPTLLATHPRRRSL